MSLDKNGLEILTPAECRALLGRTPLGRIVFTERALPAVQPVNFLLDGDDVVIRTRPGSRLATAAAGTIVAFEADDFDPEARTGWSVVVVGRSRLVTDPAELARLRALPLRSWAPGDHGGFIRVSPELVSGRRIAGTPVVV